MFLILLYIILIHLLSSTNYNNKKYDYLIICKTRNR